jgi:hypothetical protein
MATTTNYSWTTPDDTALVKDGAAAIRSLGTAIDTTVFNNAGAAIAKTIVDAKGDIIAATAADTVSRLAVGANDTVLTADSTTATGLKWAAPGAAATTLTLINTGGTTPSGATTTITGLSGYNKLSIVLSGISTNSSNRAITMRVNSDTDNKYSEHLADYVNSSNYDANVLTVKQTALNGTSEMELGYLAGDTNEMSGIIIIDAANSTGHKLITRIIGATGNTSNNTNRRKSGTSIYTGSSVISSVSFLCGAGNWDAGTIYVYGSN